LPRDGRTPHRHRHTGRQLHVRLELSVPGGHLVAASHAEITRLNYAGVAVRDAFEKMRRCLQDFSREQRHEVKRHAATGPEAVTAM
jgi:hypothetical protein